MQAADPDRPLPGQVATWLTDEPVVPIMTRREWDEYVEAKRLAEAEPEAVRGAA